MSCFITNHYLQHRKKLRDTGINEKPICKIESENEKEKPEDESESEKKNCKGQYDLFPTIDNNFILSPEALHRSKKSDQALNKYFEKLKYERVSIFFSGFEKELPLLNPLIRNEIKNICRLLDNQKTWAVISANSISIMQVPIELMLGQIICEIPYKEIRKILTVPEYSMIHIIKTIGSQIMPFDLIFNGESSREDRLHFISSLLVAISSSTQESIESLDIDVICFPSVLDMPWAKNSMWKDMKEAFKVQIEGYCLAWKIESSLEFRDECMMQKGNEMYQPIIITLQDNILFIGQSTKATLRIKPWEISTLERVEKPRPHSICLIWKSMTLNLAWNNAYIVAQFFDMLNISRRKFSSKQNQSNANPTPALIFVTDSTLLLFSTDSRKSLLLRIPLLNIERSMARVESFKTGIMEMERSRTLILETESLEADEDTLIYEDVNSQWCLRFKDEAELQKYAALLFPC